MYHLLFGSTAAPAAVFFFAGIRLAGPQLSWQPQWLLSRAIERSKATLITDLASKKRYLRGMLFNYLILAAAVGVLGAISMILSERKRRKTANRKWEEMQRERKKPTDNNNDILV